MMINSPCKGCEKRKTLCHDNCTGYAEYKATKEQISNARNEFLAERRIAGESIARGYKSKCHWKGSHAKGKY